MNVLTASSVAFTAGVVSFASPCVLPLVPTYLAVLGSTLPQRGSDRALAPRRTVPATLLFVAGFTVVFCALGASATVVGGTLSAHRTGLQTGTGIAVLVFGAVALLSATPRFTAAGRALRWHPNLQRWGRAGPPVLGAAFALAWSPCIGPILGSVLAMAASREHAVAGTSLLAFYAAGLAVPLVACSIIVDRAGAITRIVRRSTRYLTHLSGVALIAVGSLLVSGELNTLTRWAS